MPLSERHGIHCWEFANSTARLAAAFTAEDIGKVAYQESDETFWWLKDHAPAAWVKVGGGGAGQSDVFAWVNFNAVGTLSIRASKNVASVTDNGAGHYTINFAEPAPDADYAVSINVRGSTSSRITSQVFKDVTPTTTSFNVVCIAEGTGLSEDPQSETHAVIR